MRRRIYVSGRMSGIEDFNFPAFHAAAAALRAVGWDVANPAESFDGAQNLRYRDYVTHDLMLIQQCDALYMLNGWDGPGARGSVWEREVAFSLLNKDIYYEADGVPAPR